MKSALPQSGSRENILDVIAARNKAQHLIPARCPSFGYVMEDFEIDGQCIRQTFLRPETQSRLGEEGADAGAKILTIFPKKHCSSI